MSFCMECGSALGEMTPPGDDRLRLVCESCGHVAYLNPKVVVGFSRSGTRACCCCVAA